jgi:NADPH:quinone reductase-like Zn-dependent oxidoreductase
MKAAIYTQYGPPDTVVQITDVEKPVPRDDELSIKVHAASVNPLDSHLMNGGRTSFAYCSGSANQKSNDPALI